MELKDLRVSSAGHFRLSEIDPDETFGLDKVAAKEEQRQLVRRLAELQSVMYAEQKHSLLIVLQAMDGGGKDSLIGHVMRGLNPQGTRVFSFKVPSDEEVAHDFLWRAVKALPRRGVERARLLEEVGGPGDDPQQGLLQRDHQVAGVMFILHLDHDLGVVVLSGFGS